MVKGPRLPDVVNSSGASIFPSTSGHSYEASCVCTDFSPQITPGTLLPFTHTHSLSPLLMC